MTSMSAAFDPSSVSPPLPKAGVTDNNRRIRTAKQCVIFKTAAQLKELNLNLA